MQVSWIDADEVRDLIARLEVPPKTGGNTVPDLNTLPDVGSLFAFDMISEKPGVQWQPVLPPTETPVPAPEPDPSPDVSIIREKLRLIRDRAQEAGLLSREPEPVVAPEPPPAAPPSPSPPPVAVVQQSVLDRSAAASMAVPVAVAALAPAALIPPPVEAAPPVAPAPAPAPVAAPAPVRPAREKNTIAERLDEFAQWAAKQTTSEETFMFDDYGELLWGAPTSNDLIVCARLVMNATKRANAGTVAPPAAASRMQVGPGRELQIIACPTVHGNVALALVNPKQVPVATLREALALAIER